MPKILATADLHGNLPTIPECDLLLIGGDVCPMWDHHVDVQKYWLDYDFRNWLENVPARKVIGIAGNHDFVFQKSKIGDTLPWTYLKDSETDFEDLRIWGLPWVPNLPGWAFYAPAEPLKAKHDLIPKGIDIVLSHGPPRNYGDLSFMGHIHVGCKSANDMLERVKPKVFVNGHIHEGYGDYVYRCQHGWITKIYNVSYVNQEYTPCNEIVEIKIDGQQEATDPISPVRDSDSGSRHTGESTEGPEPPVHDLAPPANRDEDSFHALGGASSR